VPPDASDEHPPPSFKGSRLKLTYATQAGDQTPTGVMFVNDTNLLHFSYRRYLEKKVRDRFGLVGNPLKLVLRAEETRRSRARAAKAPSGRDPRSGRKLAGPTSP